ncbi:transmembrane protein 256-like isoform X1 [Rhopalosiphum maidis]|uniref:transmembrane protein 256-like isoform X1 n=2 Tax=Rhopalosiphum maidis TaxID=43146 RepID=UPI000F0029FD|nr:transmembrane protein 256-like isoform X1 [Rhopalosiphum maidis]XP_026805545.1 transmembrane protein 256-like isoform X1 [Rhopalosiphum maidis]
MISDSVQGAVKWLTYTNPVVTNSVQGFNSVLNWMGVASSSEKQNIIKMESRNILQMLGKNIYFYKMAGLLGASAVILGAYGAHVVSHKANPEEARNFETANRYHFYHTFALLGVPFCRFPRVTGALFISGTLIFCGTCYYNGLTADKTFNKYTPTGGMLLIAAWMSMIL